MTDPDPSARAAAEARAEALLGMHRMQQQAESMHVAHDAAASRWTMLALATLGGAAVGLCAGAMRGRPVLGAILFGALAALLTAMGQRRR